MKKKRHSPEQIIAKLREAEAGLTAGSGLPRAGESGGRADGRVARRSQDVPVAWERGVR